MARYTRGDRVIFQMRFATFQAYWPDFILSVIKFDDGKTTSVNTCELAPFPSRFPPDPDPE